MRFSRVQCTVSLRQTVAATVWGGQGSLLPCCSEGDTSPLRKPQGLVCGGRMKCCWSSPSDSLALMRRVLGYWITWSLMCSVTQVNFPLPIMADDELVDYDEAEEPEVEAGKVRP